LEKGYGMVTSSVGRPYPFIDIPLRKARVVGDESDITRLLPITDFVQGLTTIMGVGGPDGIDMEGWLRSLFGIPKRAPGDATRVNTALASMAADHPEQTNDSLLAQELNRMVEQEGWSLDDAMGLNGDIPAIAEWAVAQGWTPEQVGRAH